MDQDATIPGQTTDVTQPPVKQKTLDELVFAPNGKLTREGMVALVRAGRSFHYNGMIIWREEDVPSDEQLAQGDQAKLAKIGDDIDAQIAALQARKAQVGASLENAHKSEKAPLSLSGGGTIQHGVYGEGDTAGADGDAALPETAAGQAAAQARAEAEAQAQAQADAEASSKAKSKKEAQ